MVMPCLTKSGLGFLAFSQTGEGGGGGGEYTYMYLSQCMKWKLHIS